MLSGCMLYAMKFRRILPIAALVLMAINATGVLRALHMHAEHAPVTIHSPDFAHNEQEQSSPADDRPTPVPENDHDCDLCFSFRSMHEVVALQQCPLISADLISPTIPQPVIVIRTQMRPAAHPARGPPVC
jgi:hypothetical protein